MKNIVILTFILLILGCSRETVNTTYTEEKNLDAITEYNQLVSQSERGFSESYRASDPSFRQADPMFYEAQELFSKYDKSDWRGLSQAMKLKISAMASSNLSVETQLISLMMIDRRLLPLDNFSDDAEVQAYYENLQYFTQVLIDHGSNDLDILTKSILKLKAHTSQEFFMQARTYILDIAEKDKKESGEKIKNLRSTADPQSFGQVSKRYHEQVLSEADYAIAHLADMR